jgi:hypothetical protein
VTIEETSIATEIAAHGHFWKEFFGEFERRDVGYRFGRGDVECFMPLEACGE